MLPFSTSKTFVTNLAAYGASEVAAKLSRLLVVVAVARYLDLVEIGIAAAAIAAGDILKALTENGVGQRIISASDDALEATCATAHRIFWFWCLGLFLAQAGIAGVVYATGGGERIAGLILLMGCEYLIMPAGLVHVALAMRAGKMRQTAMIRGVQVVGANMMSVLLVFVWPSAIALILPRVLSAPVWVYAQRKLHPWRPAGVALAPVQPFISYGWAVMGVEVVKVLRLQADKIVVGVTLGAETLGLYFMAFNAGLSLSNAFTAAFSTVLFPALAQSDDRVSALRQSLVIGMALIAALVVAQALLVPVYIPLLLGDGWEGIESLVQILCLVAIPTTLWATAASWLRTHERAHIEFFVTCVLAIAVIANAFLLGPIGLMPLVIGYSALTALLMSVASIATLRPVFRNAARSVAS